jgi:hypothetical protein
MRWRLPSCWHGLDRAIIAHFNGDYRHIDA